MRKCFIATFMIVSLSLRGGDISPEVRQIGERLDAMRQIIDLQREAIEDDAETIGALMGLHNREVDAIVSSHRKLLVRSLKKIEAIEKKNWPQAAKK